MVSDGAWNDYKTLSEEIVIFRNGRRYGWSSRKNPEYHRISSPPWWYEWATEVKEYPALVTYRDQKWRIGEIGSGTMRTHRGNQVLLWRPLTLEEACENNWRYDTAKFDEDTEELVRITRIELSYLMSKDAEFDKWVRGLLCTYKAMPELNIEEVTEVPCINGCRRSFCYCDDKVTYEINEHSMTIDISKGSKTIRITLEEAKELASFLGSAKEKIKEARINTIKQAQDDLAKQLADVQNI